MELGVQYVISLKIICCSKRWKDLLLKNKFGETFFSETNHTDREGLGDVVQGLRLSVGAFETVPHH